MSDDPARLPEDLLQPTIADMQPGESGWTVPWAMDIDHNRGCWLTPGYSIHTSPGGTVQMRVHSREDGYHVEIPDGYQWTHGKSAGSGIPVVSVTRSDRSYG